MKDVCFLLVGEKQAFRVSLLDQTERRRRPIGNSRKKEIDRSEEGAPRQKREQRMSSQADSRSYQSCTRAGYMNYNAVDSDWYRLLFAQDYNHNRLQ
jgi:hypothetical protein